MRLPFWQRLARRAVGYAAIFACALMVWWFWNWLPGGDNPFQRLYLRHQVGAYTQLKIEELADDPEWCRFALEVSQMTFAPIPDREEGDFCAYSNAVAVERSTTPYSSPVQASCPMAAALFLWERDIVQPLAQEHFGAEVTRIHHVGTYACRRVYGGRTGEPSQHASANAIDIIGFSLSDDRVVNLARDWGGDDDEGRFLEELRDESCRIFTGVLGPEYNRYHHDHFHLDLGPHEICR